MLYKNLAQNYWHYTASGIISLVVIYPFIELISVIGFLLHHSDLFSVNQVTNVLVIVTCAVDEYRNLLQAHYISGEYYTYQVRPEPVSINAVCIPCQDMYLNGHGVASWE